MTERRTREQDSLDLMGEQILQHAHNRGKAQTLKDSYYIIQVHTPRCGYTGGDRTSRATRRSFGVQDSVINHIYSILENGNPSVSKSREAEWEEVSGESWRLLASSSRERRGGFMTGTAKPRCWIFYFTEIIQMTFIVLRILPYLKCVLCTKQLQ